LKTTPIPVKFDRQGHSCNFYGGFGPTVQLKERTLADPLCEALIQSSFFTVVALVSLPTGIFAASQRSLHNAPIFRLLLKVAVNGTHQCDFCNFCGARGLQHLTSATYTCMQKLSSAAVHNRTFCINCYSKFALTPQSVNLPG